MPAIFYGHPVSQPCRSCQWFLEFTNQRDIQIKVVDLLKGAHKQPEYVAKFPNGQIPSFEEDGFFLSESLAIIKYLAKNDIRFSQRDFKQDARLDEYFGQHYSSVRKFTSEFFIHHVFGKEDKQKKIAEGYETIKPILQKYETRLGKQPYILGHSLTLADFLFAPEVDQIVFVGPQYLNSFPNIRSYLHRLSKDVTGYSRCYNECAQTLASLSK